MILDPSLLQPSLVKQWLASRPRARVERGRRAAVLVPVLSDGGPQRLLFMKRPDSASSHAGEVSFPGGRAEATDKDAAATALRETHEELGIVSSDVSILGALDDMFTVSDYSVTPIVGWMSKEPVLTPSPDEVADSFWLTLDQLRNQSAWRSQQLPWRGREFTTWFFEGGPHLLWGATARIVRDFLQVIEDNK